MDGGSSALVARGGLCGGVRAPEGLEEGAGALRVPQDILLALDILRVAPSALDGLHDAPLAECTKLA